MISAFEWLVAKRYLRSKNKDSFISVISGFSLAGIALGVATLIIVMSVMNGFRTELTNKILGINSHINLYKSNFTPEEYEWVKAEVKKIPEVKQISAVIDGQAMVAANGASTGAYVKGIAPADLIGRKLISENLVKGNAKNFGGMDTIIIGQRMADTLGVRVGDTIKLLSPKTVQTVMGAIPRHKDFQVVGIFEVGMFEYDNVIAFMPMEAAQVFFQLQNRISGAEIFLDKPDHSTKVSLQIFKITKGAIKISDWKTNNMNLLNALKVERNVMFLILTLIILVAAFNIISGLVMLVKDKTSDVAILRTIGATKTSIMKIFFICGSLIGITGTMAGFAFGLLFAVNIDRIKQLIEKLFDSKLFPPEIYFLTQMPSEVRAVDVILVVCISLALSMLSTIYPAIKASKLSPVEGLKHE